MGTFIPTKSEGLTVAGLVLLVLVDVAVLLGIACQIGPSPPTYRPCWMIRYL